jgi:hypothetical protein
MRTWIEDVKQGHAEIGARKEAENSDMEQFKLRTTPVIERLRRFIESMPESERGSPRPLEFYRLTLRAKYHGKHAHSGETGEALRTLGYTRKRGWSAIEGGFRAMWYPPVGVQHD